MVYFYDPPANRKGLPRRLQDQTSWSGPERRKGAIRRVWVRYRNKLKGLPLEYIRLAALEEVESSRVCREALQEGGRPQVDEMVEETSANPEDVMEFSGDDEPPNEEQPPPRNHSVLGDVPAQLHRDKRVPPRRMGACSWQASGEGSF